MVRAHTVTDFAGTRWTIRRRWLPHREGKGVRQRFAKLAKGPKGKDGKWLDFVDGGGCFDADEFAVLAVLVLAGVAFIALLFIGTPIALLGLDLLWLFGVFVVGAVSRFVFGRPWSVEATSASERREFKIKGFADAGRLRDQLALDFERGRNPRPDDAALGVTLPT